MIFEANRSQLVSIDVPLSRVAESGDGFLAQLSNLHYDDYFSVVPLRKAIEIVYSPKPGLVVLTGDFVTEPGGGSAAARAAKAIEPCAKTLLAQILAAQGCWLPSESRRTEPTRHLRCPPVAGYPLVLRNHSVPWSATEKALARRGG